VKAIQILRIPEYLVVNHLMYNKNQSLLRIQLEATRWSNLCEVIPNRGILKGETLQRLRS